MESKKIMTRVYKDGYFDRHSKNSFKRGFIHEYPRYTLFKQVPDEWDDEQITVYSIVAEYDSKGSVSNFIYFSAPEALRIYRLMTGVI